MLFDYHTHSKYSGDVDPKKGASIDEMCQRAVGLELSGLAVTDHLEINQCAGQIFPPLDNEGVRKDIFAAKEKYRGTLDVIYGVEMAQALHKPEKTEAILAEYKYDYIIGSVHAIRYFADFSDLNFAGMSDFTLKDMWDKYLEELLELASWGRFDTLAHITYPFRYFKKNKREYILKLEKYGRDYFEPVLKAVIEKGLSLEVNTSGLRQGLGCTMPDLELVRFYYSLGGRNITVGSDAHYICDIGADIKDIYTFLKETGFEYIANYHERELIQRRIEL